MMELDDKIKQKSIKVRKIGNSRGIIIPNGMLEALNIKAQVFITRLDGKIIITPKHKQPRENWSKKIDQEVKNVGVDSLLIQDFFEDENLDDWVW